MNCSYKIKYTIFFLIFTLSINAQQSIKGIWNMGQDNTKIEITEEKDICEGKIFSSENKNAKIGNLILKDVKLVNGKWKGKLYSPKKKDWFDAVLKVEGKQLLVTVKSGLMSKTVEWKKE